MRVRAILGVFAIFVAAACVAQERPYFVTYSHEMEEPGNLEIEFFNAVAAQNDHPGLLGVSRIDKHLVGH